MKKFTTSYLAEKLNGKLIGDDKEINGIFNILKDSKKGDVVIRHWVDEIGVQMAYENEVSCIVTQNLRNNSLKAAEKLGISLIIVEKIEFSNAFALQWAIKNFAENSLRIVVTGTNGKSTTSHMISRILSEAGYVTYTNTDSKSEFNTLIDPIVAKQIAQFGKEIGAMVIEVSEVQGWLGKIMHNHAFLMTSAVDPEALVMTNVALDHIGLVNSISETFDEISSAVKAFEGNYIVLNSDDPLIKKMEAFTKPHIQVLFYGDESELAFKDQDIIYKGEIFLKTEEIPFKSLHFIQDTMAAIAVSLALNVDNEVIKRAVKLYKPLKRRFTLLNKNPYIIDDFAHNPDGILATIKSAAKLGSGRICVVSAIRGSRGDLINKFNADAIAEGLKKLDYRLIVTNSSDVVDDANMVKASEKKVFIESLQKHGIRYIFHEKLYDALSDSIKFSKKDDMILLIGAQGMDPAKEVLGKILDF
jgi:UDP-N-acetylmuramoyl-L-alanyl-D-glutamate--2,6-diaminopimelate ligase